MRPLRWDLHLHSRCRRNNGLEASTMGVGKVSWWLLRWNSWEWQWLQCGWWQWSRKEKRGQRKEGKVRGGIVRICWGTNGEEWGGIPGFLIWKPSCRRQPGSSLGRKAKSCLGHAAFAASGWRPQAGSWEDSPDPQGRAEDWRCTFRTHHTWTAFNIMGTEAQRGHARGPKGIPTFRGWWRRESAGNDHGELGRWAVWATWRPPCFPKEYL